MGFIIDTIYLAENTKQTVKVASGHIAQALAHIEAINTAGGPEKDPAFKHHQKEIRTFLRTAQRAARRLPGKLQAHYMNMIDAIARRAGVTL